MNHLSPQLRVWASWVSGGAFFLGVCSLTMYFWTIPEDGPAQPGALWSLLFIPLASGTVGVGFGVLSRAWWLVALNTLLVFAFPLVMLIGTLILGP